MALVITIVILIILATVAINFAFGDDGIIKKAQYAKDLSANSTKHEEQSMSNLVEYMNEMLSEPVVESITVAQSKGNGTVFKDTSPVKDDLNNIVYIPGGFKVATDSGTKVEEGIVIEDATEGVTKGNQFVWIPVGEYKVSTIINAEGKLTNNLSRRTFTSTGATEVDRDSVIESMFYGEGATQDEYGEPITTVAKDQIETFKTKAIGKGGFYIGRYEAGTETERTSESDLLTLPLVQASKNPYVYVTRDQAKEKSEEMYRKNEFVTSELISSYAWDSALNFICQTSKDYGYSLATTISKERANIDTDKKELTGAYIEDKYSNIYDMLGNTFEWTTEYCSHASGGPCVVRGGNFSRSYYHASSRCYWGNWESYSNAHYIAFRTILNVN